jgi:formamidopyrimidine-DNA glycosylase
MPELPEVETQKRDLIAAGLIGKSIDDIFIGWDKTLACENPRTLLIGRTILDIFRRGKYLCFTLSGDLLLASHLRMSGSFILRPHIPSVGNHDRVIFRLGDRDLAFRDTRKFGRIYCGNESRDRLQRLGWEPFDPKLDTDMLYDVLHRRNCMIKALLLDQQLIAGLGNIYCDEALFRSQVHPARKSSSLTRKETQKLLESIRNVLTEGIANRGTSLGTGKGNFASDGKYGSNINNLRVFGRSGFPCPECTSVIERTTIAQRSTCYCPFCQKVNN